MKPQSVSVGPTKDHPVRICARVVRGPSKSDPRHYWRAEVYEGGTERTVWTGRGTREEVTLRLAALLASGDYRDPNRPRDVVLHTVGDVLSYWMGVQKSRKDAAAETIRIYLLNARVINGLIGDVPLTEVTRRTVESVRDARLAGGSASATVAMTLRVLRIAWQWARDLGAVSRSLPHVQVLMRPVRSRYTPTPRDVQRLLDALDARPREDWRPWVVRLQWATGLRIGEISGMKVRDFDIEGGAIVVVHSKTRKPRVVRLRREFAAQYAVWLAGKGPNDRVWPVTDKTMRVAANAMLRELCASLHLPHWTTHGFRRAAVTRWVRAGAGLKEGSEHFGHSVEMMIKVYQTLAAGDPEDATALAALDALPGKPQPDEG